MTLVYFKLHQGKTLGGKLTKNTRMHHETLPAFAHVAAGDGVRCVEAPHFINFNYFNAAGVIMDRFCSLGDQKEDIRVFLCSLFLKTYDNACDRSAWMATDSPD